MYFLIAGYNTMTKEEQEKIDIVGISNVFRNAMFGTAFVIILGYFAARHFENKNIEIATFVAATVIGISYLLIESNSKKYKL